MAVRLPGVASPDCSESPSGQATQELAAEVSDASPDESTGERVQEEDAAEQPEQRCEGQCGGPDENLVPEGDSDNQQKRDAGAQAAMEPAEQVAEADPWLVEAWMLNSSSNRVMFPCFGQFLPCDNLVTHLPTAGLRPILVYSFRYRQLKLFLQRASARPPRRS